MGVFGHKRRGLGTGVPLRGAIAQVHAFRDSATPRPERLVDVSLFSVRVPHHNFFEFVYTLTRTWYAIM